nr:gluconate:H+ symporter [Corynebacterium glucuronolyticum]
MWVVLGIALMLMLNMKFKVNAMVSLLIAALTIGFLERMRPAELLETIQTGFGSTLGSLAIIVVFGAVIGKLMVDSGAATRLADTLIEKFGVGKVKVAMVIVGLVFGLAMFYEVAFIILAPLIIAVAVEAKVPFLNIAIPAVAATITAHSLFPPQPGPVALVDAYGADTGMVYIYALIVAIPTVIITGWVLPRFLGDLDRPVPKLMRPDEDIPADQRPSFALSLFVPLIPAIVMISATITKAFISEDSAAYEWVSFIGSSIPAMAIALIAAIYFFGIKQGRSMEWTMGVFESAVSKRHRHGHPYHRRWWRAQTGHHRLRCGRLHRLPHDRDEHLALHHGLGNYRPHPPWHRPRRGFCHDRRWHHLRSAHGSGDGHHYRRDPCPPCRRHGYRFQHSHPRQRCLLLALQGILRPLRQGHSQDVGSPPALQLHRRSRGCDGHLRIRVGVFPSRLDPLTA